MRGRWRGAPDDAPASHDKVIAEKDDSDSGSTIVVGGPEDAAYKTTATIKIEEE